MTDPTFQMIDLEAERAYWQQIDGLPGYPYSSHWHLVTSLLAAVMLRSPYADRRHWLASVRDRLDERGVVMPCDAYDAITNAVLDRFSSHPARARPMTDHAPVKAPSAQSHAPGGQHRKARSAGS